MNKTAKAGTVWVCQACGKQSHDRYGQSPISKGWDVSCYLRAVLCYEDKITINEKGLVIKIEKGGIVKN